MVEGPAQRLLSSRLRCEMSCSFSGWLLEKTEFLALECVGESHRGKPLWKSWEATQESFFPGPPLMAFPIFTPACSPQQDVLEPPASSGSQQREQGRCHRSSRLHGEGEGRGGPRATSRMLCLGQGQPEPSWLWGGVSDPGRPRWSLWGFCCRGTFVQYVLLGGVVSKIKSDSSSFLFAFAEWLES